MMRHVPPIQALQVALQAVAHVLLGLLRPRVLVGARVVVLRDGDAAGRLHGVWYLALLRLHAHHAAEAVDLGEDHLLHLGDVLDHLKVKVERRRAARLVARVVPDVQVPVLQRVFD